MTTTKNAVWEMDKNHFMHPYTDYSTFKEEGSQVIQRAEGAYVADSEGNEYLDGIAGLWCVNIGHGRKAMADTIAKQVMQMQYYNPFGHCTNEPASKLAAKLAELAPGNLNHVFYGCGGSVANDTAVRLIHLYFNMKGQHSKKKSLRTASFSWVRRMLRRLLPNLSWALAACWLLLRVITSAFMKSVNAITCSISPTR